MGRTQYCRRRYVRKNIDRGCAVVRHCRELQMVCACQGAEIPDRRPGSGQFEKVELKSAPVISPFAKWFLALMSLILPACDRLFDQGSTEAIAAADKKLAAGDFRGAAAFYEAALDGTAQTAEVHYKLALLYDDKLK